MTSQDTTVSNKLLAKGKSMALPILNSILPSNITHIENGIRLVMEKDSKKVGFLGFSFKAGTDDLRESPIVEMIERLLGKGYDIKLYDKNVNLASLVGANKNFILNKIPHISKLMVKTMDEVIEHAQTIVIGNNSFEFKDILAKVKKDQKIIDLVRIIKGQTSNENYNGICW
jgi:GDP-mannose 6-dehydrogenase